jgi:hypothetical protein
MPLEVRVDVGPVMIEAFIWLAPTPLVPNGSNDVRFWYARL